MWGGVPKSLDPCMQLDQGPLIPPLLTEDGGQEGWRYVGLLREILTNDQVLPDVFCHLMPGAYKPSVCSNLGISDLRCFWMSLED